MPLPYGKAIIQRAIVKLIAYEGHGLTAAGASLQLGKTVKEKGIDQYESVEKIHIRTHLPAMSIIDKSVEVYNAADGGQCMQYIVAVVLLEGQLIEAGDYQDESHWASDPRVIGLRKKMMLQEDRDFTKYYYDLDRRSAATGISILLEHGSWIEEAVSHLPMGHHDAVGTNEGIARKF